MDSMGAYDRCDFCGDPTAADRLNHVPATTLRGPDRLHCDECYRLTVAVGERAVRGEYD